MTRDFTLDDFLRQLEELQKLGGNRRLDDLAGMSDLVSGGEPPEDALDRARRMVAAMTDQERARPELIGGSARTRIAAASGTHPNEVEQFLARYQQVRARMLKLANLSLWQRLKLILGFGRMPGGRDGT